MGMSFPASGAAELARAADAIRRYLAVVDAGALLPAEQRADLEDGFVRWAAVYSQWKGLSYRDWREAGVPIDVLTRAGVLEFNG